MNKKERLRLLDDRYRRKWEAENLTDDEWMESQPTGGVIIWIVGVVLALVIVGGIIYGNL